MPGVDRVILLIVALLAISASLPCLLVAATTRPTTAPAEASGAITEGLRIYTAGHSFHAPFVPQWLEACAKAAFIKGHVNLGVTFIGGSSVLQQWNIPASSNRAKQALRTGNVDVLTLSPVFLPDPGIEDFARYALRFNPNTRITVQESWIPNDKFEPDAPLHQGMSVDHDAATAEQLERMHAAYFQKIVHDVSDLNQRLGKRAVFVVPCGHALLQLREKIIRGEVPGIQKQSELFMDNLGHPKAALRALVGYCHFAVIYRRTPVGLPVLAPLDSDDGDDGKLNLLLQQIAWDAVTHDPLSGVSVAATTAE